MRYHTTKKGEIAPCDAPPGRCPLNSDHYDSVAEAEKGLESKMSDSLFAPGDSARADVDPSTMKLSELNQAVKNTTDEAVINEGIARGSNRTHKNLVRNESLTAEQLKTLRDKSEDPDVRKAALRHKNFAPANMTNDEFAEIAYRQNSGYGSRSNVLKDDSVDDAKLAAYKAYSETHGRVASTSDALANPNNKLSSDTVAAEAAKGWSEAGAAISSGRMSPSQIEALPDHSVYWGNVDREKDPQNLEGYTRWSLKDRDDDPIYREKGSYIAGRVAANPNTSSSSLDKLAAAGKAPEEVYSNPNTSASTREKLKGTYPEVARKAHIMDLEREHGNLRDQIVSESSTSRPYSGAPYSTTRIAVDKEKVKEYGLSSDEVRDVLGARGYNVRSQYDAEKGLFVGEIDSSG